MNLEPFYSANIITRIHIILAISAIIIGFNQFISLKGNRPHRSLGWIWVIIMSGVAITALIMPHKHKDTLPLTLGLTVWISIGLPLAIYAIKQGNILLHRAAMMGVYLGGLVVALMFTITPGRMIYKIFFGI